MSVLSTSSVGTQSSLLGAARISVSGLVSGLDTGQIIDGLLALEQQKIQRIDQAKALIQARQTAFKGIEARLLALRTQMTQLSRTQNGLFDARVATSSDTDAFTAAASSSASAGVYQLRVNNLARAQQLASQGFVSTDSSITHGVLQLQVGDATTSITVDSTNDTLQGLAFAINNSGAAVSASIINDGAGTGQEASRLLLSAKATGIANQIVITNNLADSSGGAAKPIFDAPSIGNAVAGPGFTGTSAVQANAGAGYTGSSNNAYTFTVVSGGTVGTDNGLQIAYTDAAGANTGTLTVDAGDADAFLSVAQGVQVKFAAGTLVAGETFQVKTFVPTIQDAADASVTLGAGAGALTVTSAKNQIDSLIPGVALQLKQSDPLKDLTLTIADDSAKMQKGIKDFIAAYNELLTYVDAQARYDAETKQGGVLLGDRQATSIQEQVRAVFQSVVAGANPNLNYIGGLGITTDDAGRLVVNDDKLAEVLEGRRPGVTLADVRALFALTGGTSNSAIQFVSGSAKTRASSTPYTVNITQAATAASLTAAIALAETTIIDSSNHTFAVKVDGKTSSTLTLADGSYTRLALAQAVQAAINGDAALTGSQVNVALAGDALAVRSTRAGGASQIAFPSGTALAPLGFEIGAEALGQNVAGEFVVAGDVETAHGNGRFLIGDAGNANTADLQLNVGLTPAQVGAGIPAQVGAGIPAQVSVVRGLAARLDVVLASFLDPVNGRMSTINNAFLDNIDRLDRQKTKQNETIQAKSEALRRQFEAMEQALGTLQSASAFLNAQTLNLSDDRR